MQRVFAFCEGWAQAWDMSWFGNGHGMGCALDAQAFECTHVHGIVAGVGLLTWGESDARGSRGHGWAGHNRKHLFTIRGGALKKMIIKCPRYNCTCLQDCLRSIEKNMLHQKSNQQTKSVSTCE